ncbi:MAG: hypothetical protein JWM60_1144 [Solirubrobacterales bacterium]|nr:hypothetical protein [Solirubrobacterales bacterium]
MNVAETHIFGATWSSFGALLIGVGAVLLLAAVIGSGTGLTGLTWGGTQPEPSDRLLSGAEVAGAVLVAVGSGILLLASRELSVLAVAVAVGTAATVVYGVMTVRLRAHWRLVLRTTPDAVEAVQRASWRWCATHPLWKPES